MQTSSASKRLLHGQMSESFVTAMFLSLSGGLQDAYTYFFRGKVYANAQTGNIVLLSQHLFTGDFLKALHYLIPLVAFASGILAAELFREHFQSLKALHWRQMIVLAEILLLFSVGFFPQELNLLANAVVSFSCAMQVQTFRKVNGYAYASTMCIGNMRSGMESLVVYFHLQDKKVLHKALHYFGVILLFAIGAGVGAHCVSVFGNKTIWFSCALLLVSLCFMFIQDEEEALKEKA